MVLRADAAAVRQEEFCVVEADGPVAFTDTVHDPAERLAAFAPADLVAGVDAQGRLRIARLMLEIVPGIFRLGDSPEFASVCGRLAAVLMPTPPALLPCSRLSGSHGLFTCTADAALGQNLNAVVVGGRRVRRAPFAPALVMDSPEESPGRLFLTLRDIEAGHPDALVVVLSERGMICRRILASDRPVPSLGAWLRSSALASVGSPGRQYILDCLAHLDRQETQAATLLREVQARVPPIRGGSVTTPIAAGADSLQVIDIGCVPRMPDAAVIGPVPDDPLLMRCRAGLYAADPGMRTIEVLYLLDPAQNQQKIALFLRDVHAAYGTAARLVMVPHAATSAAALNAGVQVSRAPVVVSLGRSVLPERTAWLGALTGYLRRHADVGIVGPRLLREDHALWNDGLDIGNGSGSEGHWDIRPLRAGRPRGLATGSTVRRVAGLSPGCIAIPRSVLKRCGGFSQGYLSSDYSTADLCLTAAAAGFKICLMSEPALFRLDPFPDDRLERDALDPRAEIDRRLLERRWRPGRDAAMRAYGGRACGGLAHGGRAA